MKTIQYYKLRRPGSIIYRSMLLSQEYRVFWWSCSAQSGGDDIWALGSPNACKAPSAPWPRGGRLCI